MDYVYVVTGEHESFPGDTTVVVFRYSSEARQYKAELENDGYHNVNILESEVIE